MIIFLIFLLLISTVIVGVLGYLVFICQKKIDIYEQWVLEFKNDVNNAYLRIKNIDDRHIFERDDEVGFVFSDLLAVLQKLNTRIDSNVKNQEKNDEDDEEEENN